MGKFLALCLLACATLSAQQASNPTELPGRPFHIAKTWVIGGEGDWDYLTADPKAGQLFIAHGSVVQVVDLQSGTVAGQVDGLRQPRAIALDETGQFGYISDTRAGEVAVFDRRSFRVTARIRVASTPRLLAYDSVNKLLFAVAYIPPPEKVTHRVVRRDASGRAQVTYVSDPVADRNAAEAANNLPTPVEVIDTETQTLVGRLLFSGRIDSALCDGMGGLFLGVVNRSYVLRVDTQTVAAQLPSQAGADRPTLNWSDVESGEVARAAWAAPDHPRIYFLDSACTEPRALAVDGHLGRLYAACNNMKLTVWNFEHGELVASVPLNTPPDSLAYDPDRGLLYVASGVGSLTIVRRDATDSYAVVQVLPTRQRARTMALDQDTGEVFLVSNALGVDLRTPGGIGKLKEVPVPGSFQVLVIQN
jgi:DNA-binding beta-propeller fold protein YncE